MLIDCPACAASYHVGRSEIGDDGRTVVCPRCDAQWFVGGAVDDLAPSPTDLRTTAFSSHPARPVPPETGDDAGRPAWWRSLLPAASVAAVLVLTMASIGLRERIVRAVPRTAVLYASLGLPVNVRGLEIGDVVPTRVASAAGDASRNEVAVAGEIRNVAHRRTAVPRLSYEVRDASGTTLLTWTERAPAKTLATGKTLPFVSSPHTIPADGHSIIVRFASPEGPDAMHVAGQVVDHATGRAD